MTFQAQRETLPCFGLGPRKRSRAACAGVRRKRWKCSVVDGVLFAESVATVLQTFLACCESVAKRWGVLRKFGVRPTSAALPLFQVSNKLA